MRRRRRKLPIWSGAAVLLGVLAGCGGGGRGSSSGGPPHTDGGAPDLPDLGSVVTGTVLLNGDLDITGLTTDEVAAVLDQKRGALAVPLSGTGVQTVDPDGEAVAALGDVIFSYHNLDDLDGIGDLTIWTAAEGAVSFVEGASIYAFAVSDDGTRVLTTGHTSSDDTMTSLVLGGIDGTAPTTLLEVALGSGCNPILVFTGGTFVASHCAPGSSMVTISAIDPLSGAVTDLLTGAQNTIWTVPGASGLVVLLDANSNASLVPAVGGAATPIGSNVNGVNVMSDGSAVFVLSGASVVRVPVAGDAPLTLAPTGVLNLQAVSPDGQQLLYDTVEGLEPGNGDLWITSATTVGAVTQLSADDNTAIYDAAFTADSSQALYFTGADLHGVGTFTTAPVAGGAPVVRGQGGWIVEAYGGAKIAYADQYTPVAKRPGRVVLRTLDLSGDASPAIVATHAGAYFVLTYALDRVAFSFNDGSPQSGLYVAPLP
jgi:hypothetical protein